MMVLYKKVLAVMLACSFTATALAQSKTATESKSSTDGVAKVGKALISVEKYDQALKAEIQRGRADTPQLREEIKNTLINQELLMQEIVRQGIDKKPEHRESLARLRQNYLIDALFLENLASNPVTDQELKAAYEAEYQAKSSNTMEYQIKELSFGTEKEALAAIQRLKKGEAFDKLWLEMPGVNKKLAETWIAQHRLVPAVSNVIVYINKGSYTVNPLRVGSRWILIKVEDLRTYKAPKFEEVKSMIYASMVQKRNAELIQKIRRSTPVSIISK